MNYQAQLDHKHPHNGDGLITWKIFVRSYVGGLAEPPFQWSKMLYFEGENACYTLKSIDYLHISH